jgi:aspartate kinase
MSQAPIVLKFGGTSVQNTAAMQSVARIVRSRQDAPCVVITSALSGVTNSLLAVCDNLARDRRAEAEELLTDIKRRHREMLQDFSGGDVQGAAGAAERLDSYLARLESLVAEVTPDQALKARSRDAIVAFGEYLSSIVLTQALRQAGLAAEWFDVRGVMFTNGVHQHALPDVPTTEEACQKYLAPLVHRGRIPVTQGFIGTGPDGSTTTLGRGGSDYTAALIGAALSCDRIEIWTDVSGVMTADPRIVPTAQKIRQLSFAEAAELAYFGAKVLHPATLLPAVRKNIPVVVLNTMKPEDEGTRITRDVDETEAAVRSIAGKRGVTVINVTSARMLGAHGFLRRVFTIFDDFSTPVDLISTSEVSVSVSIEDDSNLDNVCRWLQEIGQVEVHDRHAIVCVVGNRMRHTPGIAARVFGAVPPANVRLISQGASELNVSFVVEEKDLEGVMQRLHVEFFGV